MTNESKMVKFMGFLGKIEIMWISLVLFVIGIIMMIIYFRNKKLEYKTTYGTIIDKQLIRVNRRTYKFRITYSYVVDDKEYKGENVINALSNTENNNKVKVYYNPKNPSDNRLSKKPGKLYLFLGIGMMILGGGLFYFRNNKYLQMFSFWT